MEVLNLVIFGMVFYTAMIAVPSFCESLEKKLS